jgi:hypothetical protein
VSPQIVQVGSKKCLSFSGVPVRPRMNRGTSWMRFVASSSYGSASSARTSSGVGLRTASMRPSMTISSLSFFSVASAQTRRHAAFGMMVATDECASCFAPRTRSSKYAMPLRPSETVGRPAASLYPASQMQPSARSRSAFRFTNSARCSDPISSSPS